MKTKLIILLVAIIFMVFACKDEVTTNQSGKDFSTATIYHNGEIITMEGTEAEYAEAVVEQHGKIIYVGKKELALKEYKDATLYDLDGKTLIPGLIEPHLHPSLAAIMLQNEIIAPYDWKLPSGTKKGVQGEEAYRQRITESIKNNAQDDKMYFIWGYHQLWHGDLNRELLNDIAGDKPVGIIHRSFHEIFLNDAAIAQLGITEIEFKGNPQVNWKNGHFFEGGWLALVPKMAPILLEPKSYLQGLSTMSELLLQNGITTIAEPGFPSSDFDGELQLLMKEMEKNPPYDVYLIPSGTQLYGMKGSNEEALAFIKTLDTVKAYNRSNVKFLPKQVKLFSDGAIYSQLMQMKDGYTDGHEGEWMTPLDLFEEQLTLYWNNDYKIHVHANGDLGQQMVIDLVKKVQEKKPRKDHRLTLHHMGYFEDSMAQEVADLGIEASVNPYYLWALADKYSEFGLGEKRAKNLVAIKSLTDRNIPVSFHSDFSMAPVEPLTLVWTAMNRQTSQGSKFSQDQRISVFDAMKAITIDAARTLNLDNEIGSLKVGKIANFSILKENPFKIDPIKVKDIKIVGVVYKGNIKLNKMNKLVGGWTETEITPEAEQALDFVLKRMNTAAKLEKIIKVRTQVVAGMNYDIDFKLDNGEIWNTVVFRDLQGNYEMTKTASLKR